MVRKALAGTLLMLAAGGGVRLLMSQEEARMAASSAEPGGVLEQDLWQVLVLMGVGDSEPADWDGAFAVTGGELHRVEGYRFAPPDRVMPDGRWRMRTDFALLMPESTLAHDSQRTQQRRVVPRGLLLRGSGQALVSLKTAGQSFSLSPMRMAFGTVDMLLNGRVEVRRIPPATDLSGTELREHDFPAIATGADSNLWAVWSSYHSLREEANLRVYRGGRWSRLIPVARAAEDIWRPQVSVDGEGKPWIVWSQQSGGNWDIYAMRRESDETWGALHRLSDNPLPDIEPHVASAADGTIYAVWQSMVGSRSKIRMSYLRGGRWSGAIDVTEGLANDWEPAVAAAADGTAWIAWDRYGTSYNVYARSLHPGRGLSPEIKVAGSPRFEAHASVAVDGKGRPWIAWESGGVNWGKDLGMALGANSPGSALGDRREIEVVCLDGGEWKAPAAFAPQDSLALGSAGESAPLLFADPAGNLWMAFKRRYSFKVFDRSSYWEQYLTRLDGGRWTDAIPLPNSWTRASARMGLAASGDRLWAFWPDEGRQFAFGARPRAMRVKTGSMPLPASSPEPALSTYRPAPAEVRAGHADEAGDVAGLRNHRVETGGESLRLLRGELHRHTELSQDMGGIGDGSLPEFYRYMIDAADMDFGASTDHQAGGVDYWNILSLKSADMYHFPERFVALYGYERNPPPPHGHRNIVHTRRAYPVVPFFQRISPKFLLPDTPDGELVTQNSGDYGGVNEDDTKLLYEELRKSGGLAIPHTTAGSNEWRDNDPKLDPVMEIYQGARDASEHQGAPRSSKKSRYGYVWEAWKKGYRMGVIASSDHYSTHISYAMVYAGGRDRQSVFDGIQKRRTYAATDNILLEFWLGTHFMGDDFVGSNPEKVRVKVRGTGLIDAIHLIRDQTYVHKFEPRARDADVDFVDYGAGPGQHWYYVRVEQQDGQLAWSSPIWVRYR